MPPFFCRVENDRGFVFLHIPLNLGLTFRATALSSLQPHSHHEMLLSVRLQTVNF